KLAGRTLSRMPSEQKGAYDGHLALPAFSESIASIVLSCFSDDRRNALFRASTDVVSCMVVFLCLDPL
ncbi:MAG: hypothetical protein ACE5KV_04255, partial [Thermoplasmata archaeon]